VRVAILTVSDRAARGEREDASGPALRRAVEGLGHEVVAAEVVADERKAVTARILALGGKADLVLTTGGTGLSPRDVTPEATRDALAKEIPGFPEEIRRRSAAVDPRGLLSRGVCGILPGGALVLNLPGSPGGAVECLGFVAAALPHAATVAKGKQGDCGGGFSQAAAPRAKGGKR
jgi:molybdenum cofactor synthesis domain-containing protein